MVSCPHDHDPPSDASIVHINVKGDEVSVSFLFGTVEVTSYSCFQVCEVVEPQTSHPRATPLMPLRIESAASSSAVVLVLSTQTNNS